MEEIIFVGTGGGIGMHVESADINMPPDCIRLDRILEIFLPREASGKADTDLLERMKDIVKKKSRPLE